MIITEVRFYGGKTQRFLNAKQAAKRNGYPDVPTYLRSTGQVSGWCEELTDQELETQLAAERARSKTLR